MRIVLLHQRRANAFTRLELIVIATVMCILLALLISAAIKARGKQQRIACAMNMKVIASGYFFSSEEHLKPSTWQVRSNLAATNFSGLVRLYFAGTNQANPRIFVCPTDTRKPATNWATLARTNVSYFVSLNVSETFPQSVLAGDRNIMTNGVRVEPGLLDLAKQTNVTWDGTMHRFQGHILMGDGSIQQLGSVRLREYWTNQATASINLAVP